MVIGKKTRDFEIERTGMNKEKTAKDAGIVMLGNFLALVLGLISSVVVAAYFGAGKEVDAFMAAYMVPDMLSQILMSVFVLVLIPSFLEHKVREGEKAGWEIMNKFITVSLTYVCLGTMVLVAFSPVVVKLTAPGFSTETYNLSCRLLRILSFSVLLSGCLALGSSILQAHNDFALPAISRPILQLFVIISIVVFGWSIGIYSYAIGTIVGLIVGLSIQMAAISRRGKVKLDFDFYHPVVKSSFSSLPPLIFARLLNHGTNIAITALASTLVVGSISALNFAWKIVSIPMLVLSSVSVVLYPGISEEIAKKDFFMVGRILRKAIRASIYIGAPFSMFFMVAGIPVVRLLFERGNFTPDQSYLTAKVLMAYCIMIVFQSVNLLIGNTYWALRLMKLRLKIEAVGVLVCIALSLILRRFLGPAGLAFSISCQYFVLMLIGLIILEKRVPISFNRGETIKFGFRISIACLFLGLAIKTSMWTFSSYFGSSLWGKTGYVLCLGLIGGVTYVVFCHLLKIGENKEVLVLCRGKIIYLMQGIRTRHFFV